MLFDEIKQGESKVLEFKEKLPSDSKKYVKTVLRYRMVQVENLL